MFSSLSRRALQRGHGRRLSIKSTTPSTTTTTIPSISTRKPLPPTTTTTPSCPISTSKQLPAKSASFQRTTRALFSQINWEDAKKEALKDLKQKGVIPPPPNRNKDQFKLSKDELDYFGLGEQQQRVVAPNRMELEMEKFKQSKMMKYQLFGAVLTAIYFYFLYEQRQEVLLEIELGLYDPSEPRDNFFRWAYLKLFDSNTHAAGFEVPNGPNMQNSPQNGQNFPYRHITSAGTPFVNTALSGSLNSDRPSAMYAFEGDGRDTGMYDPYGHIGSQRNTKTHRQVLEENASNNTNKLDQYYSAQALLSALDGDGDVASGPYAVRAGRGAGRHNYSLNEQDDDVQMQLDRAWSQPTKGQKTQYDKDLKHMEHYTGRKMPKYVDFADDPIKRDWYYEPGIENELDDGDYDYYDQPDHIIQANPAELEGSKYDYVDESFLNQEHLSAFPDGGFRQDLEDNADQDDSLFWESTKKPFPQHYRLRDRILRTNIAPIEHALKQLSLEERKDLVESYTGLRPEAGRANAAHLKDFEGRSEEKTKVPPLILEEMINNVSYKNLFRRDTFDPKDPNAQSRDRKTIEEFPGVRDDDYYDPSREDVFKMTGGVPLHSEAFPPIYTPYNEFKFKNREGVDYIDGVPFFDLHQYRRDHAFSQSKQFLALLAKKLLPTLNNYEPHSGHLYPHVILADVPRDTRTQGLSQRQKEIYTEENRSIRTLPVSMGFVGAGARTLWSQISSSFISSAHTFLPQTIKDMMVYLPKMTQYSIGFYIDSSLWIQHFSRVLPFNQSIKNENLYRKSLRLPPKPVHDANWKELIEINTKAFHDKTSEMVKRVQELWELVKFRTFGPKLLTEPSIPHFQAVFPSAESKAITLSLAEPAQGRWVAGELRDLFIQNICDGRPVFQGRSSNRDGKLVVDGQPSYHDCGVPIPITPTTLGLHSYRMKRLLLREYQQAKRYALEMGLSLRQFEEQFPQTELKLRRQMLFSNKSLRYHQDQLERRQKQKYLDDLQQLYRNSMENYQNAPNSSEKDLAEENISQIQHEISQTKQEMAQIWTPQRQQLSPPSTTFVPLLGKVEEEGKPFTMTGSDVNGFGITITNTSNPSPSPSPPTSRTDDKESLASQLEDEKQDLGAQPVSLSTTIALKTLMTVFEAIDLIKPDQPIIFSWGKTNESLMVKLPIPVLHAVMELSQNPTHLLTYELYKTIIYNIEHGFTPSGIDFELLLQHFGTTNAEVNKSLRDEHERLVGLYYEQLKAQEQLEKENDKKAILDQYGIPIPRPDGTLGDLPKTPLYGYNIQNGNQGDDVVGEKMGVLEEMQEKREKAQKELERLAFDPFSVNSRATEHAKRYIASQSPEAESLNLTPHAAEALAEAYHAIREQEGLHLNDQNDQNDRNYTPNGPNDDPNFAFENDPTEVPFTGGATLSMRDPATGRLLDITPFTTSIHEITSQQKLNEIMSLPESMNTSSSRDVQLALVNHWDYAHNSIQKIANLRSEFNPEKPFPGLNYYAKLYQPETDPRYDDTDSATTDGDEDDGSYGSSAQRGFDGRSGTTKSRNKFDTPKSANLPSKFRFPQPITKQQRQDLDQIAKDEEIYDKRSDLYSKRLTTTGKLSRYDQYIRKTASTRLVPVSDDYLANNYEEWEKREMLMGDEIDPETNKLARRRFKDFFLEEFPELFVGFTNPTAPDSLSIKNPKEVEFMKKLGEIKERAVLHQLTTPRDESINGGLYGTTVTSASPHANKFPLIGGEMNRSLAIARKEEEIKNHFSGPTIRTHHFTKEEWPQFYDDGDDENENNKKVQDPGELFVVIIDNVGPSIGFSPDPTPESYLYFLAQQQQDRRLAAAAAIASLHEKSGVIPDEESRAIAHKEFLQYKKQMREKEEEMVQKVTNFDAFQQSQDIIADFRQNSSLSGGIAMPNASGVSALGPSYADMSSINTTALRGSENDPNGSNSGTSTRVSSGFGNEVITTQVGQSNPSPYAGMLQLVKDHDLPAARFISGSPVPSLFDSRTGPNGSQNGHFRIQTSDFTMESLLGNDPQQSMEDQRRKILAEGLEEAASRTKIEGWGQVESEINNKDTITKIRDLSKVTQAMAMLYPMQTKSSIIMELNKHRDELKEGWDSERDYRDNNNKNSQKSQSRAKNGKNGSTSDQSESITIPNTTIPMPEWNSITGARWAPDKWVKFVKEMSKFDPKSCQYNPTDDEITRDYKRKQLEKYYEWMRLSREDSHVNNLDQSPDRHKDNSSLLKLDELLPGLQTDSGSPTRRTVSPSNFRSNIPKGGLDNADKDGLGSVFTGGRKNQAIYEDQIVANDFTSYIKQGRTHLDQSKRIFSHYPEVTNRNRGGEAMGLEDMKIGREDYGALGQLDGFDLEAQTIEAVQSPEEIAQYRELYDKYGHMNPKNRKAVEMERQRRGITREGEEYDRQLRQINKRDRNPLQDNLKRDLHKMGEERSKQVQHMYLRNNRAEKKQGGDGLAVKMTNYDGENSNLEQVGKAKYALMSRNTGAKLPPEVDDQALLRQNPSQNANRYNVPMPGAFNGGYWDPESHALDDEVAIENKMNGKNSIKYFELRPPEDHQFLLQHGYFPDEAPPEPVGFNPNYPYPPDLPVIHEDFTDVDEDEIVGIDDLDDIKSALTAKAAHKQADIERKQEQEVWKRANPNVDAGNRQIMQKHSQMQNQNQSSDSSQKRTNKNEEKQDHSQLISSKTLQRDLTNARNQSKPLDQSPVTNTNPLQSISLPSHPNAIPGSLNHPKHGSPNNYPEQNGQNGTRTFSNPSHHPTTVQDLINMYYRHAVDMLSKEYQAKVLKRLEYLQDVVAARDNDFPCGWYPDPRELHIFTFNPTSVIAHIEAALNTNPHLDVNLELPLANTPLKIENVGLDGSLFLSSEQELTLEDHHTWLTQNLPLKYHAQFRTLSNVQVAKGRTPVEEDQYRIWDTQRAIQLNDREKIDQLFGKTDIKEHIKDTLSRFQADPEAVQEEHELTDMYSGLKLYQDHTDSTMGTASKLKKLGIEPNMVEDMQRRDHDRMLSDQKSFAQRKLKQMATMDNAIRKKTGDALSLRDVAKAQKMDARFTAENRMEMSDAANRQLLEEQMERFETKMARTRVNKLTRLQTQEHCILIIHDPLLSSAVMRAFIGTSGNTGEYLEEFLTQQLAKYNVIHNPINNADVYRAEDATSVPLILDNFDGTSGHNRPAASRNNGIQDSSGWGSWLNPLSYFSTNKTTTTSSTSSQKINTGHLLDRDLLRKLNQNWLEAPTNDLLLPPHQRKNFGKAGGHGHDALSGLAPVDPSTARLFSEVRSVSDFQPESVHYHPYESPAVPGDPLSVNILHNLKLSDYEIVDTDWQNNTIDRINLVDAIPPFFLPLLTQYSNEMNNNVGLGRIASLDGKNSSHFNTSGVMGGEWSQAVQHQFGVFLPPFKLEQFNDYKRNFKHQYGNGVMNLLPPFVNDLIYKDLTIFESFIQKVQRFKKEKISAIRRQKFLSPESTRYGFTQNYMNLIDEIDDDDWNIDVDDLLQHHQEEEENPDDDVRYDIGYWLLDSPVVDGVRREVNWIKQSLTDRFSTPQKKSLQQDILQEYQRRSSESSERRHRDIEMDEHRASMSISSNRLEDDLRGSSIHVEALFKTQFHKDEERDQAFKALQEAHLYGLLEDDDFDIDDDDFDDDEEIFNPDGTRKRKGKRAKSGDKTLQSGNEAELEFLAKNSPDPMIRRQSEIKLLEYRKRRDDFENENSARIFKHSSRHLDSTSPLRDSDDIEWEQLRRRERYGTARIGEFDYESYVGRDEMKRDFEAKYPGEVERRKSTETLLKEERKREYADYIKSVNEERRLLGQEPLNFNEHQEFQHGNIYYQPQDSLTDFDIDILDQQRSPTMRTFDRKPGPVNAATLGYEAQYISEPLHRTPRYTEGGEGTDSDYFDGDDDTAGFEYGKSNNKGSKYPTKLDDSYLEQRKKRLEAKKGAKSSPSLDRKKSDKRIEDHNRLVSDLNRSFKGMNAKAEEDYQDKKRHLHKSAHDAYQSDLLMEGIRDVEERRERAEYRRRQALIREQSKVKKEQYARPKQRYRVNSDGERLPAFANPFSDDDLTAESSEDDDSEPERWYDDAEPYDDDDDDDDEEDDNNNSSNPSRGYYNNKNTPKGNDLKKKLFAEAPMAFGREDALLNKSLHYLGRSIQDNLRSGLLATLPNENQRELIHHGKDDEATQWITKQLMQSKNRNARRFLHSLNTGVLSQQEAAFVAHHGLVDAVKIIAKGDAEDYDDDYSAISGQSHLKHIAPGYQKTKSRFAHFEESTADDWDQYRQIQRLKYLDTPFIDEVTKGQSSGDGDTNRFDAFSRGGALYESEVNNNDPDFDGDESHYLAHARQSEYAMDRRKQVKMEQQRQRQRAMMQQPPQHQQDKRPMSQKEQQKMYQQQQRQRQQQNQPRRGGGRQDGNNNNASAPAFDLSQFPPEQQQELLQVVGEVLESNDINIAEVPPEHREELINNVLAQIIQQSMMGGDDE